MEYQYIDPQKIKDMLFNDGSYVVEFCEAGITSFEEFITNFEKYLMARNMDDLRKAGHKIKPGAQMMGADEVVEEYEHSKQLLEEEADDSALRDSVEKMTAICTAIQDDLSKLAESQNQAAE